MKLGIFGGTFNPVHLGHIELVREFIKLASLDRVLLIPTKIPPHKSSSGIVSEAHRLEMCRIASQGSDDISVCDIELKRDGKSYTVDTVNELLKIYPYAKLYLIIGADMFMCFDEWRCFREIAEKCVICTAARNDDSVEEIFAFAEKLGIEKDGIIVSRARIMTVSSTQVREMLGRGECAQGLIDERVYEYIRENGLYRKGE